MTFRFKNKSASQRQQKALLLVSTHNKLPNILKGISSKAIILALSMKMVILPFWKV